MSKRLVTSDWWDAEWFASCPTPYQLLWYYIWTRANAAGIWQPSQTVVSRHIPGVSLHDAAVYFCSQVSILPNGNWCIPSIVRMVNPRGVYAGNNATDSILSCFIENNVSVDSFGFPILSFLDPTRTPAGVPTILYSNSTNLGRESAERGITHETLSEDITSPNELGKGGDLIDPVDSWRMERCQPWARSLQGCIPILNKSNWQIFKGLVDHMGLEFVKSVALDYRGKYKWPSDFNDICVAAYEETIRKQESEPDPVDPKNLAELAACGKIIDALGWAVVVERLGIAGIGSSEELITVLSQTNKALRAEVLSLDNLSHDNSEPSLSTNGE